ncbi:response regulator [Alkalimonas collagenimarina]|uniref:histidine kinase n=1 Tax=Alkalimonas collagenimarina TaxID=400390 RepID=A0ABT9H2C9_9GAMM|nr:ATP-binding hybrid sensor histidine kinase/response regulator [Alkalimonas collagenimarina]MDP4537234.1 response regulator [Alkalimonas collagenimarina]
MLKLSQFNELTERPALAPDHRLFVAKTAEQQQVFIHQHSLSAASTSQALATLQAEHPWLVQALDSFEEGGYRYRVVPMRHYTLGFFEVIDCISQQKITALTAIQSLLRLLQQIHQAGFILGELKAESLYWSATGDEVNLLNSRFASTISSVHPLQVKTELDLAMLRTLAPEATGRVHCPLDQRADLYALGVLSYALIAGQFPFEQQQALELVHAHIAKKPTDLLELKPELDPRLAHIIHTLLHKDPNQRYHSVQGVMQDIESCTEPSSEQDKTLFIPSVYVGIRQLPFPDTLYERADALQVLEHTFALSHQSSEMQVVAVQGYSGSGKTSVIAQLHPLTLDGHTFFIQGKHDQYLQNSVFSGLKSALEQLAESILQEPESELKIWQQLLQLAAGDDAFLLTELIPEWAPILTPAPKPQALANRASQSRFNQLLLRIFRVFPEQNCTLVLFLDDMQWADRATLRWLELLAEDPSAQRIMLLLSFRKNEVLADHPLQFTLDAIAQSHANLQHISINPLSEQATLQLLTDTLQQTEKSLQPLADMLIQKTSGNPFYLKQFLLKLHHEKLLYCCADGIWRWDLTAVSQQTMSDQHAEVVAERLNQFDAEAQQLLRIIALLGDSATMHTLAGITGYSVMELEQHLTGPINTGILTAFKAPDGQQLQSLHFSHDRLQQAAFQLATPQTEQQLHATIARYYLADFATAQQQQQHVFEFITHLNAALPLSVGELGAEKVAEFNLMAADKALATNAYDTAHAFFVQARQLLENLSDPSSDDQSRAVLAGLAQSSYLTQNYPDAWHWCLQLDQLTHSRLQRMQNCQQKILILFAQNQLSEAFDLAAEVLAEVGIDITVTEQIVSHYAEVLTMYAPDNIAALIERPALQDDELLQAMDMLGSLFTVAYIVGPLHYMTVSYHLLKLSLQHGHCASSALGYLGHGMNLVAAFGQYSTALEFADLALDVNTRYQGKFQAQLDFQRAAAILPWNAPLSVSIQALEDSFQQALKEGNLEYAAHSALFGSFYRVMSGQPLQQVAQYGDRAIQFLTEKQFPYNLEFSQIWQQLTFNLTTVPRNVLMLEGEAYSESTQLAVLQQNNNHTILFCYHCIKLILASLMDEDEQALEHIKAAEPLAGVALSLHHQTEYYFFAALTYARLLRKAQHAPNNDQASHWHNELNALVLKFESWSEAGPDNHQYKVFLLHAEQAALANKTDAWQLYQQAIHQSEQQGFLHHLAIAHERVADYWQQMHQPDFAAGHRLKAYQSYQQWQAAAKLQQLQSTYPELRVYQHSSDTATSGRQLDLISIFKASETLSGQVDLTAFLDTMLHIMVENAGAQNGCLLFASGEEELELQASTSDKLLQPPANLLNLVRRTGKAKLYNDTSQVPLLKSIHPQLGLPASLLCIPIIVNGAFRGILYLQHDSMTGAFPEERIQVLQLLANQTAILFENTRLSQQLLEANKNLEQKVASRTRELAQAKIKAEAATDAKSAFLARMSHEIRTPINAVIGLSRLASKRVVDHEQLDLLGKIRGSGEMLLSLVNDILDFSKVEAGKLTLERTRLSIHHVVQQAINMTALKAHSKGLELVADISVDIPKELIGDPLRIQQLLINLLNNAVKFTDKGSICIMLHGDKSADRSYKLHGSVTDTGIGMTERQRQRLFKSFHQADDSITRKYGGSGLGLTICKQLCELMSGDIWLESEEGYGSTFYFTIALQLPEHDQPAVKRPMLSQRKLRALVVDDMALTRMVLLKQLDELGIQAEQTNNGEEAVAKVKLAESNQQGYDFILMDWRMPEMDGIEATRRIQQELGSRAPHILMVSAYDKAAAKAAMQQVQIDQFLEKPVNYSMLLDALGPLLFDTTTNTAALQTYSLEEALPDLLGKRLLLVEDHVINRQVALGFLQETGADIDVAVHGAEAVSKLKQRDYDLVLMDIQMPEMDGLTATQLIRQQLQLTELPIVAMTAHALPEDIEKSRAAGMNEHLTKPIVPEQLYRVLQQQLQVAVKQVVTSTVLSELSSSSKDPLQLDEAKARANLGPQASLYPSLLHIFYNEHKELPKKLRHQLQHHDYESISREMHSLKAAAAYIGAFAFAAQCAEAESQLLAGQPDADEIDHVIAMLNELMNHLKAQVEITEETSAIEPISHKQLNLELHQLLPLLQQSDFAAEAQLERLKRLTKQSNFAAEIADISHNVSHIEFETATEQLQALLNKLAKQSDGDQK